MEYQWHRKPIQELFSLLNTSERGLNKEGVEKRIKEYGENKLPEAKTESLFIVFLRQFQSPLIYMLICAGAVMFFMKNTSDALIIAFVLLFNAVVGTFQEGKAQNTLLALKKFAETNVTVLREGVEIIIPDIQLVPGDVIILREGERVSADARLIFCHNLKVDEASLTGESEAVHKSEDIPGSGKVNVSDQKNMVFKGTYVVAGSGKAIVVATGINTFIGKISKKIIALDSTELPLKSNIRYLSRLIIFSALIIGLALFLYGFYAGEPVKEIFLTIVALMVSIIPEGLPIVITIVLATGVWRMSKRNALVKRLQAVESLGQTNIIAVDKTGTITKNEMAIKNVYVNGKIFDIKGVGYEPKGEIYLNNEIIDPLNHEDLLFAGKIAAFCADARIAYIKETNTWKISGDPTEAAMLVFSEKIGFHKDELENESPLINEFPFDYKTKFHATVHKNDNKNLLSVVGSPETVLDLCRLEWSPDGNKKMGENKRKELESVFWAMSEKGMRVLAFAVAFNPAEVKSPERMPPLSFGGFFAMQDMIRQEAKDAIEKTISAGIKVVMISGDHLITTKTIAKEIGILKDSDGAITGNEIDNLNDSELAEKIAKISVFARVTPDHKLRIIKAYKNKGNIVAMTGDGVNDALSLIAADLGVAMGKIGTEVAKEASDIVLLDDNFETIVAAIGEGRNIYKTIKKVILYLFSTSLGEVFTIAGAIFLGMPLPILPGQIIWLNFVTDGFLDVSLAMEPEEDGLIAGKFKRPNKWIVDGLMVERMLVMTIPMFLGTLFLFNNYYRFDISKAWTISLTALAVFQWFNAWNCRSEEKSIFKMNPISNKFLAGSTLIVIALQMFAVYSPFMQKILHTVPLNLYDWLAIGSIALSIIAFEEIRKFFHRRFIR